MGETSWLTAETDSGLVEHMYWWDFGTGGSMAAFVCGIFGFISGSMEEVETCHPYFKYSLLSETSRLHHRLHHHAAPPRSAVWPYTIIQHSCSFVSLCRSMQPLVQSYALTFLMSLCSAGRGILLLMACDHVFDVHVNRASVGWSWQLSL